MIYQIWVLVDTHSEADFAQVVQQVVLLNHCHVLLPNQAPDAIKEFVNVVLLSIFHFCIHLRRNITSQRKNHH